MTQKPLKVGFVGLGLVGAPITTHLLAGEHQLFVYILGKIPISIAESSATKCVTARGVAERADVIITMVPELLDAQSALLGTDGVASGMSRGKVVVDMGSNSPIATRAFAQKITALGCDYLDAPVPGGVVGLRNAALSVIVRGPEAAFERVKPLLELMEMDIRFGPHWPRADRGSLQPSHRG